MILGSSRPILLAPSPKRWETYWCPPAFQSFLLSWLFCMFLSTVFYSSLPFYCPLSSKIHHLLLSTSFYYLSFYTVYLICSPSWTVHYFLLSTIFYRPSSFIIHYLLLFTIFYRLPLFIVYHICSPSLTVPFFLLSTIFYYSSSFTVPHLNYIVLLIGHDLLFRFNK